MPNPRSHRLQTRHLQNSMRKVTDMTQYLFTYSYQRTDNDFYVEPDWCSKLLFQRVHFHDRIYDPACGIGSIVKVAQECGLFASGSDLVDRNFEQGYGKGLDLSIKDFFVKYSEHDNIVSNPP